MTPLDAALSTLTGDIDALMARLTDPRTDALLADLDRGSFPTSPTPDARAREADPRED